MNAEAVVKIAIFAMFGILAGVGAEDLVRWIMNEQTISHWLRQNPGWFLWPAAFVVAFLAAMTIHLFAWRN